MSLALKENFQVKNIIIALPIYVIEIEYLGYELRKSLNFSSVALGDTLLTQESDQVRNILIATSYRSGSTFLGELLNQYPGTFYYFEPLHYYSQKMVKEDFLESLFRCQFGDSNHGFWNIFGTRRTPSFSRITTRDCGTPVNCFPNMKDSRLASVRNTSTGSALAFH